ncbi:carbohydrate deacetylase [Enterococcus sp. BWT-B8]|uniref:carbohydrate deacetylase n=1 Tax=unclassified Enterococcus TaxID=2608891 RepID=UPI001E4D07DA|nr:MULTISPECIES: carbohydrate deacetylase [unclassified Enterococcus]MCB5952469.1 carbohydrate deacetylase [Enterococcus sp. BWT-B8]MCB5953501.1 carbohydrate deacetylase [Enterococcus sp. CWB-B31]
MGKVIINSDDFGYSRGVNYGIIDAYQKGVLTSTTLMANMPGFEQAVELKKQLPELGVGVHLTLTCGKPILKNLQTIVDGDSFKPLNFYEQPFMIDEEELYQEWNAQIQKVFAAGITPTHLDSHHHTHTFGGNQKVVVALAQKYELPVRGNFERKDEVKHVDYFERYFDDVGSEDFSERQIEESMEEYLEKLLDQLRTARTTEIMCHAAYIDQELLNGSSFVRSRVNQVEFLIHSDFAETVRTDKEIELITYKDL